MWQNTVFEGLFLNYHWMIQKQHNNYWMYTSLKKSGFVYLLMQTVVVWFSLSFACIKPWKCSICSIFMLYTLYSWFCFNISSVKSQLFWSVEVLFWNFYNFNLYRWKWLNCHKSNAEVYQWFRASSTFGFAR